MQVSVPASSPKNTETFCDKLDVDEGSGIYMYIVCFKNYRIFSGENRLMQTLNVSACIPSKYCAWPFTTAPSSSIWSAMWTKVWNVGKSALWSGKVSATCLITTFSHFRNLFYGNVLFKYKHLCFLYSFPKGTIIFGGTMSYTQSINSNAGKLTESLEVLSFHEAAFSKMLVSVIGWSEMVGSIEATIIANSTRRFLSAFASSSNIYSRPITVITYATLPFLISPKNQACNNSTCICLCGSNPVITNSGEVSTSSLLGGSLVFGICSASSKNSHCVMYLFLWYHFLVSLLFHYAKYDSFESFSYWWRPKCFWNRRKLVETLLASVEFGTVC